jgi:uncharacterized YigZ family protein
LNNLNVDSYLTISSKIWNEIKIIDSRFIASVFPISVKEEAEDIIKQLRKEFYDANHNCSAYRLGISGEVFRYSDDGEPSGTAGIKIFSAIKSKNLSDLLLVVTRYFGGTKLGVGGLSRAYFDSAMSVLDKVKIVEKVLTEELNIKFSYDFTNQVMHAVSKFEAKILDTSYDEDVIMAVSVRRSMTKSFTTELFDLCSGNVKIKLKNEV